MVKLIGMLLYTTAVVLNVLLIWQSDAVSKSGLLARPFFPALRGVVMRWEIW
ncbi:MAG: hypothetical protein FJY85_10265 [Deltaproteobacteria bacterium]|nr:hypothetical protein [Deltaproteobacteria bacterium]